ncbi:MAG: polyether ionophore transport system permease protein [Micromonosporaceae bacterium]|jgi:ABC-2 type transport system permease protein|nr:polyether ionophore transport system permease protein [Micromonosporaceae bacterium]
MTAMVGTGPLVRLILRRDRIILPLWVLVFATLPISYASANAGLLTNDAARHAYYQGIVSSPAQLGLLGPVFGDSIGALTAWRVGFLYVLLGLASVLSVIRHTRAEEESGRRELIGSTVVGRAAAVVAAVLVTVGANLLIGLIASLGLIGVGQPAAGSLALGAAIASVGCVFTGIGGLAAQLTTGSRAARGLGAVVLVAAFTIRAAGDAGGGEGALSWLSWLSPVGWAQQVRPFAAERWWVLALPILTTLAVTAVAFAAVSHRDLGAGVVPTLPGPAAASPVLRSPLALAWRLQRGVLLSWILGFGAFGAVLGAIGQSVADQFGDNPQLVKVLHQLGGVSGLVDAYFASSIGILGIAAAGYAVSATLRLRSEEESQRAEPLLATSVSRVRWTGSHLLFGLLGPAVILTAGGLMAGLVYGASTGKVGHEVSILLSATVLQLPAVWVVAGLAVALFGLLPRLTALAWGALAAMVLLGQLGPLLRLDQWVMDVSPFTHLPRLPGGDLAFTPLVWLVVVATAFTTVGVIGFRRRDVG